MFLKYKFISNKLLIQTTSNKYDVPVNDCTHSWTLSVQCKGAKKVTVDLHESFTYPTRDLEKISDGNFLLKSEGWGEFEMRVNIFLKKGNKKITIPHNLVLIGNKYPVINKKVDCIVQKRRLKKGEKQDKIEKTDEFKKIEIVINELVKQWKNLK